MEIQTLKDVAQAVCDAWDGFDIGRDGDVVVEGHADLQRAIETLAKTLKDPGRDVIGLWGRTGKHPAAIAAIMDAPPSPTDPTPVLGRNIHWAFGLDPIDTGRLEQLMGIMAGMGFIIEELGAEQSNVDWARVKIRFAQLGDPRVAHEGCTTSGCDKCSPCDSRHEEWSA